MLPQHCHSRVRVAEQADLAAVRGLAADLAATAGLSAEAAGRLQLIVSELATNLLRHAAGGGVVMLRVLDPPRAVECIGLDQGPGIADLGAALADRAVHGSGAGGSLGYGLGAVRRLADHFDIHSEPAAGTAILARVAQGPSGAPMLPFDWGAVMLPMSGAAHCGDGWVVHRSGLVAVIDGLGHGEGAAIAARRAEALIHASPDEADPRAVLVAIHQALRNTRGAVVAVARIGARDIAWSSVGNVTALLLRRAGEATSLPGRWGIVGYNASPPPTALEAWAPGDHLILHSDGCARLAQVFAERRLRHVDPTLAAAILLRDGGGAIDDQTVLVLRNPESCP